MDFDNGLNTAISKLREVLGDSAEEHQYIETMPRRGYRFVAPVQDIGVPLTEIHRRELDIQRTRIDPGVALVTLAGKITLGHESQQIELLIADLLSQGEQRIIFDISGIDVIDSTGIGIIVVCSGKVKGAGGEFRVVGAKGDVEDVFKRTHVDHIVCLYPNTAAAMRDFIPRAA